MVYIAFPHCRCQDLREASLLIVANANLIKPKLQLFASLMGCTVLTGAILDGVAGARLLGKTSQWQSLQRKASRMLSQLWL